MPSDESGGGESGGGASGEDVASGGSREDARNGEPANGDDAADVVLQLPDDVREEFRDPLGPIYADADELLTDAGSPIVAVGDVVTYHLARAGRTPDVSVVDWRTEREAVDDEVGGVVGELGEAHRLVTVANPAATLTAGLLGALGDTIGDSTDGDGESTVIEVSGEEDLATLPAVLAAPDGASVVYGQPGEGMVLVVVDGDVRERVRGLVETLEGEHGRARRLLGLDG